MYKFVLLLLLPASAWSEETCSKTPEPIHLMFPTGHPDVICNAHTRYEDHWNSCARLPTFMCEGHPSTQMIDSYLWTCTFKKVGGYHLKTRVRSDYKTLEVDIIPHTDFHPVVYAFFGTIFFFVLVCACCHADPDDFSTKDLLLTGFVANAFYNDDDTDTCSNWS